MTENSDVFTDVKPLKPVTLKCHTELERYKEAFNILLELTNHHDVIHDYACVTADKLGNLLEALDPKCFDSPEYKPCTHNKMVPNIDPNDPDLVWKCADCGYVYGTE